MAPDDTNLIRQALGGDEEAFEEVIRLYGRRVYALAYGILQDTAEAEDVTQETFLKAHRHRWRLRDPAKFPAWLFSVARHRALDLLRRRKGSPLIPAEDSLAITEPSDEFTPHPATGLEEAERHEDIHRALANLPEKHRTALTLRYLEGLNAAAIEETMGLSNGALRGILGRALASLRKTLQPLRP